MSTSQKEKAQCFRSLHDKNKRKHILILPNAWDVPSSRIFENAGFEAVATSSAGLMVSLGYPDGELIGRDEFFAAIRRIAGVLSVPLSVDAVSGFGKTPELVEVTVREIIESGGIGLNIEDFGHASKTLYSVDDQVEKIKRIKSLGESMDLPIVINARTDALRYAKGDAESKLDEAIRRGIKYRDAGSDCVYPMGLADAPSISKFVEKLDYFPVNVMIRKGLPPIGELEKLGVARVSFGPSASYAALGLLKRASKEILENGTFETLIEGAITFDELNDLALPKA